MRKFLLYYVFIISYSLLPSKGFSQNDPFFDYSLRDKRWLGLNIFHDKTPFSLPGGYLQEDDDSLYRFGIRHGANAMLPVIFWADLEPTNSTNGNQYNWNTVDAIFRRAQLSNTPVFIRLQFSRPITDLNTFIPASEAMTAHTGEIATFGYLISASFDAVQIRSKQRALVSNLLAYIKSKAYANLLMGISFTNSPMYEGEYTGSIDENRFGLFDYSTVALASFRSRIENRYLSIDTLNKRWGTTYQNFGQVTIPILSNGGGNNQNYSFNSVAGRDFYDHRNESLISWINDLTSIVKGVSPRLKTLVEVGSAHDPMSPARGTVGLPGRVQTDGFKQNSGETYPIEFSVALSQYGGQYFAADEFFSYTVDQNNQLRSVQECAGIGVRAFQQGASLVSVSGLRAPGSELGNALWVASLERQEQIFQYLLSQTPLTEIPQYGPYIDNQTMSLRALVNAGGTWNTGDKDQWQMKAGLYNGPKRRVSISIMQDLIDPVNNTSLVVNPTMLNNIVANGATTIITVNSNVTWTVSEQPTWININAVTGSNNGSFTITVNPNTGNTRIGTVKVSDSSGSYVRTITISQQGLSAGNCPYTDGQFLFSWGGGSGEQIYAIFHSPSNIWYARRSDGEFKPRSWLQATSNIPMDQLSCFAQTDPRICIPPSPPTLATNQNLALATLTASGCAGTITWSTGATGSTLNSVQAGTYTATCTVNNCTSSNSNAITILNPSGPTNCVNCEGHFDIADCNILSGWIWDAANPNTRHTVEIYEGSTLVATGLANVYRSDLQNAGKGDGQYGFFVNVPQALKNNTSHTLIAKSGGYILNNSKVLNCASCTPPLAPTLTTNQNLAPATLTASGCAGTVTWSNGYTGTTLNNIQAGTYFATCTIDNCTSVNSNAITITNGSGPTNCVNCEGHFDIADCNILSGWIWDAANPNTRHTVEIYEGSTLVATGLANVYRSDLQNAGKGDGQYGFFVNVPQALKNNLNHTLIAKVGNYTLSSIKTLTCPSDNSCPYTNGQLLLTWDNGNEYIYAYYHSGVGTWYALRGGDNLFKARSWLAATGLVPQAQLNCFAETNPNGARAIAKGLLISPEDQGLSVRVAPNPNNSEFTLSFQTKANQNAIVSITDESGRLLMPLRTIIGTGQEHSELITLPSQIKGLILLNVRHEQDSVTKKVIVDK